MAFYPTLIIVDILDIGLVSADTINAVMNSFVL